MTNIIDLTNGWFKNKIVFTYRKPGFRLNIFNCAYLS